MLDTLTQIQHLVSDFNGWIAQTLNGNKLIAGAATASLAGSLFYLLRKLPLKIWMWMERFIFFTYHLEYGGRDYNSMINVIAAKFEYALQAKVSHRRAHAKLVSRKRRLVESLSNGSFFFKHKNVFIYISRRQEKATIGTGSNSQNNTDIVTLSLTALRFQRNAILSVLNESTKEYMVPGVYQLFMNSWQGDTPVARRMRNFTSLPVLAIDSQIKETIDIAIDNFLKNRDKNNELDIPHKLTFMLYGEPGTGKSALGEYVAFRLKTSLFCANASSLTNHMGISISDCIEAARENIVDGEIPVVLFDDCDTFWHGIRRKAKKKDASEEDMGDFSDGIALGKILTALQSPVEVNDCVGIFTTNHLEKIDPAIYRPGRMTVVIEIGRMQPKSIMEYFEMRYDQKWPTSIAIERALRACDLSSFYENNHDNPQGFIKAVISQELAADEAFQAKAEETIS